jgi:hypothetical protein
LIGSEVVPPPNLTGILEGVVVLRADATVAGFLIRNSAPPTANFQACVVLPEAGATLRNNTIREAPHAGVYCYNAAGGHEIRGNVIRDGTIRGLYLDQGGVGSLVEGNTIVANHTGVQFDNGVCDLGGGSAGSAGGNTISCNTSNDLRVTGDFTIFARNNLWDHAVPTVDTTTGGDGIDIHNANGDSVIDTTGSAMVPSPCP